MRADLTITTTGRYYRDSYNPTNLWLVLGMSYWDEENTIKEKGYFYKNGTLKPIGAKYLLTKLKRIKLTREMINAHVRKHKDQMQRENWNKYFTDKYAEMLAFWQEAVDKKSSVVWSC
ncbi:MAG: hypothetical protein Q8O88_00760 [bacterium]|nr:hypothetical protein [bacterium]